MTREQVDAMNNDLARLKNVSDQAVVNGFKKHMDIEMLLKAPMVPQDAMIYNYLQYEFTGTFRKTKLLARYEKEVLREQSKVSKKVDGQVSV